MWFSVTLAGRIICLFASWRGSVPTFRILCSVLLSSLCNLDLVLGPIPSACPSSWVKLRMPSSSAFNCRFLQGMAVLRHYSKCLKLQCPPHCLRSPQSPEHRVPAQASNPWRREYGSRDDLSNSNHWLTSRSPSCAFFIVTGLGEGRRIKAELYKDLLVTWSPLNPPQEKRRRGNDEKALERWSIWASRPASREGQRCLFTFDLRVYGQIT